MTLKKFLRLYLLRSDAKVFVRIHQSGCVPILKRIYGDFLRSESYGEYASYKVNSFEIGHGDLIVNIEANVRKERNPK